MKLNMNTPSDPAIPPLEVEHRDTPGHVLQETHDSMFSETLLLIAEKPADIFSVIDPKLDR